jgi:hypothetical protein
MTAQRRGSSSAALPGSLGTTLLLPFIWVPKSLADLAMLLGCLGRLVIF